MYVCMYVCMSSGKQAPLGRSSAVPFRDWGRGEIPALWSRQPQVWCGPPVPPRRGPHWGLLRRGPLSRGLGLEELKSPGPQGPGAGGQSGCGATWPSPSEWLSGGRSQRGGRSAVWALVGPLCPLRALWGLVLGPWVGGALGPTHPCGISGPR